MGKGARAACIATPMLLTIAALVTVIILSLGGWLNSKSGDGKVEYDNESQMEHLWMLRTNFSKMDFSHAPASQKNLTFALEGLKGLGLSNYYRIYLWNYCTSNDDSSYQCSGRYPDNYFNPITVWGLDTVINHGGLETVNGNIPKPGNSSTGKDVKEAKPAQRPAGPVKREEIDAPTPVSRLLNRAPATSPSPSSVLTQPEQAVESWVGTAEDSFGDAAAKTLQSYQNAGRWMWISYQVAFFATLATLLCSISALFSRWGSFITWICSIVASLFFVAAATTTTVIFVAVYGALKPALDPYNVDIQLGTTGLAVVWLQAAFSVAATFFWLLSACCCSGRSNPHHRSNRGGQIWNNGGEMSGPYGPVAVGNLRSHGRDYIRVGDSGAENVALRSHAQPMAQSDAAQVYEPYRGERRQSM